MSAITTVTLALTADQLETLKQVLSLAVKPGKATAGAPKKQRRQKGDPPKEKGPTPAHLVKWNSYVDTVYEEVKALPVDAVWDLWIATEPMTKPKKDSGEEPQSRNTPEERAKFKVIRKIAMAIAAHRKATGQMPAEYQHTAMTAEEKKAAAAARKAAKASGSSSESESSTASAAKPVAVKKARVAKAAPVPVAAPVAEPEPEDEGEAEGDELEDFKLAGRQYLKHSSGACWVRNSDGTRGKWAGQYNSATKKIDASAPEPQVEEDDAE